MPRSQTWSDEQIQAALVLAAATSLRQAAAATGIPFGTLARHSTKLAKQQRGLPKHSAKRRFGIETTQAKREVALVAETRDAVLARAIEVAGDQVAGTVIERIQGMTRELYDLAELSMRKVKRAISDPGEDAEAPAKQDPAWTRALVGVMAQSLEKAQLLAGRPTIRQQVDGSVTHQADLGAVLADPEALALARLLFRRQVPGEAAAAEPVEPVDQVDPGGDQAVPTVN